MIQATAESNQLQRGLMQELNLKGIGHNWSQERIISSVPMQMQQALESSYLKFYVEDSTGKGAEALIHSVPFVTYALHAGFASGHHNSCALRLSAMREWFGGPRTKK
ncbi:MAG: hypothetical protein ACQESG_00940 [Nanobdellota archaeon]